MYTFTPNETITILGAIAIALIVLYNICLGIISIVKR
jgi:Sec-independent protein secretion pathway component TatC